MSLSIQLLVGLYFIGLGLPGAFADGGATRKPISVVAQLLFGLLLTATAMFGVAFIR